MDEAIQHLRQHVAAHVHASSSSHEENRLRDVDVRLFSASWFSREEEARQYFCGLSNDAFEWLEEHFLPKVCHFAFLPPLLFCCFFFLCRVCPS